MIKKLRALMDSYGIRARYPFLRNAPESNSEYWKRLDALFSGHGARAAIVGMVKPKDHWLVAQPLGSGEIKFTDSEVFGQVIMSRSMLHAGYRRPRPGQWLLEPTELILFEKLPRAA
jgi:hypothetical protein